MEKGVRVIYEVWDDVKRCPASKTSIKNNVKLTILPSNSFCIEVVPGFSLTQIDLKDQEVA
jgi:hypothetical protein